MLQLDIRSRRRTKKSDCDSIQQRPTPQNKLKSTPMLMLWRWICFYPGQQTQVRISL